MTRKESDKIISEQNKSTEEILKAVAKVKSDYKELCNLKDMRIAELEEKISVLLSCKNCLENKGGYICQKEYENKCLAQKIEFIKELQQEIAELERHNEEVIALINAERERQEKCNDIHLQTIAELEKENDELKELLEACKQERVEALYRNEQYIKENAELKSGCGMCYRKDKEQLTKAKELLKETLCYLDLTDCVNDDPRLILYNDIERFIKE